MAEDSILAHARVDENGRLELTEPVPLAVGEEVIITIERVTPEKLAEEDAAWDALFERSPEHLAKLVQQARTSIEQGTATDFDPDTDEV
ncbi:MAG: hypothetical protein ACYDEO_27750 [Aggregatilineales bacterium]